MKYFLTSILLIAVFCKSFAHLQTISCSRREGSAANCSRKAGSPVPARQDQSSTGLDRPAFYKAMAENNKLLVNEQLTALKTVPENIQGAFMGAMLMKKAGLGGNPANKLKLFRQGHKMLETAIGKDPENAEYRFLRLMIQEHAPGMLNYKYNMEKDCEFIRKSYQFLPGEVQQAIADYNKNSKVLKLGVS